VKDIKMPPDKSSRFKSTPKRYHMHLFEPLKFTYSILHRKKKSAAEDVFEKRPKKANALSAIMEDDDFMDTTTSKPR